MLRLTALLLLGLISISAGAADVTGKTGGGDLSDMQLRRKLIIKQHTEVAHNSGWFYDSGAKLQLQVFVVNVLKCVS